MALQIAERWFEMRRVDDAITLLWEPHVVPLMRCNIWHLRGRDRDLLIDTGMGIASLEEATRSLIDKPVVAVATHTHVDHMGGHYEFPDRLVHRAEAENLAQPDERGALFTGSFSADFIRQLRDSGYQVAEDQPLITALPHAGYEPEAYELRPAPASRLVEDGDVVDTGDRHLEVLHLPGHSPGSIGLWEAASGTLFSGDCLYDGPLLDGLHHSDIAAYCRSMRRLRDLPVRVVHAGHEPSFGRARMVELIDDYLARREA